MPTFPKNFPSHFPKSKKEEAEFGKGKGKEDILICKKCKSVYWYKEWHHQLDDYPGLRKSKRLKFTICPACQMILDGKFEGEIILEGVPEKLKKEIKKLAQNFGKRAFEKDPLDRIISIKENREGDVRILTTENQLAQRLAKKIKQTFAQKGKISISHSKKESTLRVKVKF